jgi:hypothetical protein
VLVSTTALGRAPPAVVVGVTLVVLGVYALVNRRSLSAAFSRLTHRDGGATYAIVFLIAPTTMVVVGVLVLIVSRLLKRS